MVCCSWVDGIIFIVCPHSSELPLQTHHSNITCVVLTIFGDAEENVFIELCCSANAKKQNLQIANQVLQLQLYNFMSEIRRNDTKKEIHKTNNNKFKFLSI